jgi:hypothetical protein
MTDRPIIISAPMIQALLDGRKTQTRRVLNGVPPQPASRCAPGNVPRHPAPYLDAYCGDQRTAANPRGMSMDWNWWQVDDRPGPVAFRAPCVPGDRLWVREAFIGAAGYDDIPPSKWGNKPIWYVADGEPDRNRWWHLSSKTRSPIHMPRWASRLTLTVTNVRVQRLQDISEEDAIAEGATSRPRCIGFLLNEAGWSMDWSLVGQLSQWAAKPIGASRLTPLGERDIALSDPEMAFASYWNDLHGPDAWASNPWVCALTFTVEKRNIDAPAGDEGRN